MRKLKPSRYDAGAQAGEIAAALLDWFATHQRDLPWRRSRDPYRIWVSEVMLQQTRVETVIPYYARWLEQFPTLSALACAPEEQVLKAWEGLGYYSRARNLHHAVQEVAASYAGQVPDDPEAFSRLKGVGHYTMGAVLSIAFNREVPAVDGNVLRVLSRLYLLTDDIAQPATRKGVEALAQALIPPGQAGAFNQALMELGALVCLPLNPACLACPVGARCRARREGRQRGVPVKTRAKKPRPVDMVAAVIRSSEGRLMLVRRPPNGLLGGLWEFPGGQRPEGLTWEQAIHQIIRAGFGLEVALEAELTRVKHTFTHLRWDLRAYSAEPATGASLPPESERLRWVTLGELSEYPLPVAHQKIAAALVRSRTPGKSRRP